MRARRELADAAVANPSAASPLELVASALSTPLVAPGLPLHVAAFSLRDEDPSKIQVLIHADIGKAYISAGCGDAWICDQRQHGANRRAQSGRRAARSAVERSCSFDVHGHGEPGSGRVHAEAGCDGRWPSRFC